MANITKSRHPEYQTNSEKYKYVWHHYTGKYADDENIGTYLNQKKQRESNKAYQSRKEDSDPVLVFPTAVDGLNGILFGNNAQTERDWGQLGDPEEPDSIAYTLSRNVDGEGMDWDPLFKQVGIKETVLHKVWGLVEGVQTDDDGNTLKEASIKIINPQSVVDWYPSSGPLEQVLVQEQRDARSSLRDSENSKSLDTYTLYELEGWTRFQTDEDGNEQVIGHGKYEYYNDNDRTKRILPIFPCEIPIPRHVGYLLAKKQNHIFNKKSSRDFGVQTMSFAILNIVGTKKQYDGVLASLEKGANAIRQDPDSGGQHDYLSPDSSYLSEAGKILEADIKNFYTSAFKQYGDAAKQVTATEIRLESRSGIEAFLNLLVTSVDEFENGCLWRLMQVYFPDTPAAWGSAKVQRSRDFQPKDIQKVLESMGSLVLNADRAGAMSLYRKVELLNPEITEEEINEEVDRINKEQGAVPVPANMEGA